MTQEFESVLTQLADESRPVRSLDLFPLSDLGRERLPSFSGAWSALAPGRRLELISELVEQAESNIHLNFHAILRSLMTDPDAAVRKLAIEGLWEDEKINLIPPLISRLREDEAVEVRATAAVSLGRYVLLGILEEIASEPASTAEAALYETWFRQGELNEVRRRALEGLAYGSVPDLHELILNAYYDEDTLMRQSAIFAMGRTADSRWSKLVLTELESYEPAMRFEAAQAAGEMGLRAAVQPLIRHLDDGDEAVREASVAALGKIGGAPARRALQALLQSEDEALVQAAEDALAELSFAAESAGDGGLDERRRSDDEDDDDDELDLDDEFDLEDELDEDDDEFAGDFEDEDWEEDEALDDEALDGEEEWDEEEDDADVEDDTDEDEADDLEYDGYDGSSRT